MFYVPNVLPLCFYSRTPGSRQPSPAEEALTLTRPTTLLAATHAYHQQHLQHNMFNASMEQHHNNQLNSYHPLMNHQMQAPHMNGVGGMQVQQVIIDCGIARRIVSTTINH